MPGVTRPGNVGSRAGVTFTFVPVAVNSGLRRKYAEGTASIRSGSLLLL